MGRDKDEEDSISGIRNDDRKVEMARRGWEEDTRDPAVELLKELRHDVREGE